MTTYAQARADHEYLWETYAAAGDMTGGYVDQGDLERLLKKPTKVTARDCYADQICYWFQHGVDGEEGIDPDFKDDPMVIEIAERYCCEDDLAAL